MAYLEDPEVLREKMKKWIVSPKKEEVSEQMLSRLLVISHFLGIPTDIQEPIDVTSEIKDLKSRVRELERRVGGKREITKADIVYEHFRKGLEETDFGKIVAIDTEREEIVGKGDTILEAYNEAKERTGKDQFDFKRVGYKYLYKV